jgi:sec-independent protein translocase protein TatB
VGSIGAPEVLVILVLALLVLGPERLPQAARTLGRWAGEFRRITGSLQAEVRDVVDEVMRPVNETATVATQSFTSTFTSEDATTAAASPVEPDAPTTEALPSSATSEPLAAGEQPEPRLAADVPLPRVLPAPPVDPSLN